LFRAEFLGRRRKESKKESKKERERKRKKWKALSHSNESLGGRGSAPERTRRHPGLVRVRQSKVVAPGTRTPLKFLGRLFYFWLEEADKCSRRATRSISFARKSRAFASTRARTRGSSYPGPLELNLVVRSSSSSAHTYLPTYLPIYLSTCLHARALMFMYVWVKPDVKKSERMHSGGARLASRFSC
jgi:hypothetical protein